MSERIVPLISSGIAGPLGVLHLPRLWLKASLEAAGKLHPQYAVLEPGGFDEMVLEALEIDGGEFREFIRSEKPTYNRTEDWILGKKGGELEKAVVETLNATIEGYFHDDKTRGEILATLGLGDDRSIRSAIDLNNLDDWAVFFAEELE